MDEKLLFEVDLSEEGNGSGQSADELELISRAAVEDGRLDDWGERVFADSRVRQALTELGADPPTELLTRIEKLVGQPKIDSDRVRQSLARILGAKPSGKAPAPKPSEGGKRATGKSGQEYPLDHHLAVKPAAIVDLFEQVDAHGQSLGGDVTRRIRKFYVGYYAGSKERSFFTAEVQRQKIWIYLSLDPTTAQPWNDAVMRDVREIGHYGMGDTEYVLRKPEQLDEVKALIRQAYDRVR
jgi:predicted transport protein